MSEHHATSALNLGNSMILAAIGAESTTGGVSLWTQVLALAGFAVTLISALPKIVEGVKLLSRWASYLKPQRPKKPVRFTPRVRED